MGTETTYSNLDNYNRQLQNVVKLNNPQMGTETHTILNLLSNVEFHHVKLNNPQMGTETHH